VSDRVELYSRLPATEDLDWWRDLAFGSPDGRVLYVGCGTGRLGAPLAEVCDELVGVDHDPEMLAAFRHRVAGDPDLAGRVRLVEADAAELDLGERFGLVVLPSNLLNGIVDPAQRTEVARAAAAHCRDDGRVVLQVLNPYWMACQDPSARGRIHPADGSAPLDVAIRMIGFDPWEQRQRATITYRFADGVELADDIDAVALYPRELRALVFQAGLRIEDRWGSRPGRDDVSTEGGSWHLVCRR
jgi:SAM-dependent methyltransferase